MAFSAAFLFVYFTGEFANTFVDHNENEAMIQDAVVLNVAYQIEFGDASKSHKANWKAIKH
jgi:hypothetical protein